MSIGQMLKECREKNNLTQEDVASKAKIPIQLLADLENGKKKITAKILEKLIHGLPLDDMPEVLSLHNPLTARDIGSRIRALREGRSLSLMTLAELANISFTYLSEIERGVTLPAVSTLRRLADIFDVPLKAIISTRQERSIVSEKLQLIRTYRGMTQKELAQQAGLSPGLIGQLETGKVQASLKTLDKLSRVLGTSVCYLILEQEELEEIVGAVGPDLRELLYKPEVQMIIGSVCQMESSKLKLILNFIEMLKNPVIK
ncbi:MAG: helix-turn-helix domain-containing protein [bacterium]|jgi:transcriptional regulator with XRE-family HTH domain